MVPRTCQAAGYYDAIRLLTSGQRWHPMRASVKLGIPLYTPPAATKGSRQSGSILDPLDTPDGGSKTWLDRRWPMCG